VETLRACFEALPGNRAVGVDGVTKEQYGANLEENPTDLSARLRNLSDRPQPKWRSDIPKPGSEQGRSLGISCFEDKLVEPAVKWVLEPSDEAVFEDSSHGATDRNAANISVWMSRAERSNHTTGISSTRRSSG